MTREGIPALDGSRPTGLASLLRAVPSPPANGALEDVLSAHRAASTPLLALYLSGDWSVLGMRAPEPAFLSHLLVQALRPCDQVVAIAEDAFLLLFPGENAATAAQVAQRTIADLSLLAPELAACGETPLAITVLRGHVEADEAIELAREASEHASLGPLSLGGLAVEAHGFESAMPLAPGMTLVVSPHMTPAVSCQATLTEVRPDGLVLETGHPLMPQLLRRVVRLGAELPCDRLQWKSVLQTLPGTGHYLSPWPRRLDLTPRRRSPSHTLCWSLELGGASGYTLNVGEGGFQGVIPTGAATGVQFRPGRLVAPSGETVAFTAQIVSNEPHRQIGHRLVSARFVKLDAPDHARLSDLLGRCKD